MDSSRGTRSLPPGTGRWGKAGAAVTAAAALANVLAYLVPMLGARTLNADDLGAIATVMAVLAVAGVPGTALQLVVAMTVARHGAVPAPGRLTSVAVAATVVPMVLLTPVLAGTLRLPWQTVPLAAVMAAAVIVSSGWLGVMQGAQRFTRLAVGMAALGVARCGGVIAGLALGWNLVAVMACGAAVAVAAAGAVRLLLPSGHARSAPIPGLARDMWAAGSATLALFVLTSADLIAARHLLPASASAEYAVLNVLTKGAIWAPQVITIVALPSFARGTAGSRRFATLAVFGVGAVLVAASAAFGTFALRLVGGPAYEHLSGNAPAFAAAGALYALLFVLTNAQVARGAKASAAPAWVAVAGFAAAAFSLGRPSIEGIVACAIVTAGVTVVAVLVAMRPGRVISAAQEEYAGRPGGL